MNEVTKWMFDEIEVRTLTIDGEPYFIGKDVAQALGYKDTFNALKKHVDDEDKLNWRFASSGQNREMCIINESGLYSLILSSKLQHAKRFKHWVTSEVLPTIRRTGSYSIQPEITDQQKIEQLHTVFELHRLQAIRATKETALALAKMDEINHVIRHPELLEHADYLLEVKS